MCILRQCKALVFITLDNLNPRRHFQSIPFTQSNPELLTHPQTNRLFNPVKSVSFVVSVSVLVLSYHSTLLYKSLIISTLIFLSTPFLVYKQLVNKTRSVVRSTKIYTNN